MKLVHALVLLVFAIAPPAEAGESPQRSLTKTPVQIKSFFVRSNRAEIQALVQGATTNSQVVLLTRHANRQGLRVAVNEFGEPILPTTSDSLPAPATGELPSRQGLSRWAVAFYSKPELGKILEVYAIVCTVQERGEWSRSRDYRGFQYLPFDRSEGIDDALELLRDFGWVPTGLTRVAP